MAPLPFAGLPLLLVAGSCSVRFYGAVGVDTESGATPFGFAAAAWFGGRFKEFVMGLFVQGLEYWGFYHDVVLLLS